MLGADVLGGSISALLECSVVCVSPVTNVNLEEAEFWGRPNCPTHVDSPDRSSRDLNLMPHGSVN